MLSGGRRKTNESYGLRLHILLLLHVKFMREAALLQLQLLQNSCSDGLNMSELHTETVACRLARTHISTNLAYYKVQLCCP